MSNALGVLDERIGGKFKDYSDRCIAIAQIARTQSKTIADLTAEQERQKKNFAGLHRDVNTLSESVNAQILNSALQSSPSETEAYVKENSELKIRLRDLQIELEELKNENKILEGKVSISLSNNYEKENADLKNLVAKLQSEIEEIRQEKSILELTMHSNDRSGEVANLKAQIEQLEKELDDIKSQKELLELTASLKNDATTDSGSKRTSIGGLSDLLAGMDPDESKGGLLDLEFSEEDYFYREKNMKSITRAEKLLLLVGDPPSSSCSPDPTADSSRTLKKVHGRSPAVLKKKK